MSQCIGWRNGLLLGETVLYKNVLFSVQEFYSVSFVVMTTMSKLCETALIRSFSRLVF